MVVAVLEQWVTAPTYRRRRNTNLIWVDSDENSYRRSM